MAQIFDAVSTTGLSVDGIDVTAHKTRHELGGADALNIAGLSGALADPQKVSLQDEGTLINSRAIINFVGAGVTVADDGGNSRINVTIPGGSGMIVQENGSTVEAAATTLNFQNGVVATSGGVNIANLNVDYGTSTQPVGVASAGSATTLSRSDHVHASSGGMANGASGFAQLTTLFSTSSNTYVPFLTTTFTTTAQTAYLLINFSCGSQASNGTAVLYYAIYINGVFQHSCGTRVSSSTSPQPSTIVDRAAIAPSASTTVEIRVRTSAGTLSCDPYNGTTGIDGHHATLLIVEVSA